MTVVINRVDVTLARHSYADPKHATLPRTFAEKLAERLPRATELVKAQRTIAQALIEAQPRRQTNMALADKMKHLADRVNTMPKNLETLLDAQLTRLDQAEADGKEVIQGVTTFVDSVSAGIAATKDIMNQITNGAPS